MEAQMHRPHDQEHPQHHHGGGMQSAIEEEGEGEHHHEKKSVLKKVKAKAKKIKDSLKHGLSPEHELEHEHEQGHDHDYEEEDEDEEMVQDPEVHGAPIYESSVIRSVTIPQQDVVLGPKPDVNLENPTIEGEDRYDSKVADQGNVRQFLQGQEFPGKAGENLSKPTAMEAHTPEQMHTAHFAKTSGRSNVQGQEGNVGEPVVRLGAASGLEEDPHSPKDRPEPSNYQSKVTDPTSQSGEAEGMAPLVSSFGKMVVEDETESRPKVESEQKSFTGSHNQFAPQSIPTEGQFAPVSVPHKASEGPENPETTPKHFDASKSEEMSRDPIDGKPSSQGIYTDKISSAASAVTDKAAAVKNVVVSKLRYGGTGGSETHDMHKGEHNDVEPSGGSGSTNKISSATSVIANKAAAAKNVVASKLGYGGSEGATCEGTEASTGSVKSASPADYAHKAATAITEAMGPVYEKVADVGSSVMSKVQGTGRGQGTADTGHEGKSRGTDKGVSMKEYLAEKFRPGEEDKALSEVISDTLQRQKGKTGETGEGRPMEKVTESEEVAERLGTGKENPREGEDAVVAGSESSGNGVVDRLQNAISSWLAKGGESQTSQGSECTPLANTGGSATG